MSLTAHFYLHLFCLWFLVRGFLVLFAEKLFDEVYFFCNIISNLQEKNIFLPIKLKISYFKCRFWLDLWFSIQKGKLFFWKKEMQLSQYCRLCHILIWIFWTLKGKNGFWCNVETINLENAYLFVRDSFCNLCDCCCNILYQLYLIFLVFVLLLCFSLWLFNLD